VEPNIFETSETAASLRKTESPMAMSSEKRPIELAHALERDQSNR
jgi:hypothetical protein